jgi:PST family polysaccharide transporter
VRGSAYNVAGAAISLTLGFIRGVLLARLLLPEHFGIVSLAVFFNDLAHQLRAFGIDDALVQRATVNPRALATYFTFRLALGGLLVVIVALAAPLAGYFYPAMPLLPHLMLAFAGVAFLRSVNLMQETLLMRELRFPNLVWVNVMASLAMTIVAPTLAWYGLGLWTLVAEQYTGQITRAVILWGPRRIAWPRFGWDAGEARWFWRFGFNVWASTNLDFVLARFDTFWAGTALGDVALGYYAQAGEFTGRSRRLLVGPLLSVFFPTFSRLQDDRPRLRQAFVRSTSLVVRFIAGIVIVLGLTAHELIELALGPRWLPMVATFQLLAVYRGAEIISRAPRDLLVAVGIPERLVRIRFAQCCVLIPALVIGSLSAGIAGVAAGAALAMITGTVLLFRAARQLTGFAQRSIWLSPAVATAASAAVVIGAWGIVPGHDWIAFAGRLALASSTYAAVLMIVEGRQLLSEARSLWSLLR